MPSLESAYVSIRQQTPAYASIRQQTPVHPLSCQFLAVRRYPTSYGAYAK